jgi:hypothetical protein
MSFLIDAALLNKTFLEQFDFVTSSQTRISKPLQHPSVSALGRSFE